MTMPFEMCVGNPATEVVIAINTKKTDMKKVEFMKLNLQQENILSKEERKATLGGAMGACYMVCMGDRHPISNCNPPLSDLASLCNGEIPSCCSCLGGC